MIFGVLAIVFFLLTIFMIFIFWNAFQDREKVPPVISRLEKLYQMRGELLLNLKDLENDLLLHKVTSEDYEDLRLRFLNSASDVYKEIENLEKSDPFLNAVSRDVANHVR